MLKMRTPLMLLAAGCLVVTPGHARAELVTNGSFELTDIADGTSTDAFGNLNGWTVTRTLDGLNGQSNVFLHDRSFFGVGLTGAVDPGTNESFDGTQFIALNANQSASLGVLTQDLTTVIGQEYTVSFAIAGAFSAGQQSITVDAGGVNALTQGATDGAWTTHAFNFVANSTTTTLTVTDNLQGSSIDNDIMVDDVSVVEVPEPGSMALLGLGGLLIARRRR